MEKLLYISVLGRLFMIYSFTNGVAIGGSWLTRYEVKSQVQLFAQGFILSPHIGVQTPVFEPVKSSTPSILLGNYVFSSLSNSGKFPYFIFIITALHLKGYLLYFTQHHWVFCKLTLLLHIFNTLLTRCPRILTDNAQLKRSSQSKTKKHPGEKKTDQGQNRADTTEEQGLNPLWILNNRAMRYTINLKWLQAWKMLQTDLSPLGDSANVKFLSLRASNS